MQTFIVDHDMLKSFEMLDNKRLGKQRVEAIQIAKCLLIEETKWKNHPAVKMWEGYENYLVGTYITLNMAEWKNRGFVNTKCSHAWEKLRQAILKRSSEKYPTVIKPSWITDDFIRAHRSNLIRKDPEFYKPLWQDIPYDLSYIWPTKINNKGD